MIKRNPDHAGALHLYVHAVEASADPQRGVAAADHLRTLIPGSGHLVHMPAHIYSRVGRWHDAVLANQVAIKADDAYLAICRGNTQGRVSARLRAAQPSLPVVRREHGRRAARWRKPPPTQTAQRTDLPDLMRQPGFAGLQQYWLTPWFYACASGAGTRSSA